MNSSWVIDYLCLKAMVVVVVVRAIKLLCSASVETQFKLHGRVVGLTLMSVSIQSSLQN